MNAVSGKSILADLLIGGIALFSQAVDDKLVLDGSTAAGSIAMVDFFCDVGGGAFTRTFG